MLKKIAFIFSFLLAQTADKLLDLFWLYYIYQQSQKVAIVALFAAIIVVVRIGIFLLVRQFFNKSSFYSHYILAYSFAFLMILLLNKLSLEQVVFILIVIKEFYSAFRITGTKAFLNHNSRGRKWYLASVNAATFIVYPVALLILKFYVDMQIENQVFSAVALLVSPAMILTFRLYSKSQGHKFLADKDLRETLHSESELSNSKKVVQIALIVLAPMIQTLFFIYSMRLIVGGFNLGIDWVLILLLVGVTITLILNLIDGSRKSLGRYAEYSGKVVEVIVFFITAIVFFIIS